MQDATQDSRCFTRDSNRVPLEQKAVALPMAKEQNRNAVFPLSAEGHWSRRPKMVTDMDSKVSKYTSFLSMAELVTVRKYYLT